MTTEEKLAAIENELTIAPPDGKPRMYYWTRVPNADVRWLIAEVRRLQTPAMFGKTILDMIETHCPGDNLPIEDKSDYSLNAWLRMRAARDEAIADKEREYARGRADERAKCVSFIHAGGVRVELVRQIERGEHVEAE